MAPIQFRHPASRLNLQSFLKNKNENENAAFRVGKNYYRTLEGLRNAKKEQTRQDITATGLDPVTSGL